MASPSIAHRKEEILDLLDRFRQRPGLTPPADAPKVTAAKTIPLPHPGASRSDARTGIPRPPVEPEAESPFRRASRREKQLRSERAAVDRLLEEKAPVTESVPPPSVVPVARRLLPAPAAAAPPPRRRSPPRRASAPEAPPRQERPRPRHAPAERVMAPEAPPRRERRRGWATDHSDTLDEPLVYALIVLLALHLL